jgi:hypothetical protein
MPSTATGERMPLLLLPLHAHATNCMLLMTSLSPHASAAATIQPLSLKPHSKMMSRSMSCVNPSLSLTNT